VALFCQEIRKRIGAFAAVLGGVDTLVFSAGIGENSPVIRARICANLEFLGVQLEPAANDANDAVISAPGSRVTVRVIPTDEELMIAKLAIRGEHVRWQ
jgi:acetate kinase